MYVQIYKCVLSFLPNSCLSACFPVILLPVWLTACLLPCHTLACLPAFLTFCPCTCLTACLPVILFPVCLSACLLPCHTLACLPACLPFSLSVCFPACFFLGVQMYTSLQNKWAIHQDKFNLGIVRAGHMVYWTRWCCGYLVGSTHLIYKSKPEGGLAGVERQRERGGGGGIHSDFKDDIEKAYRLRENLEPGQPGVC